MISSLCSAHLLRSSISSSLTLFPTPCRPITVVHIISASAYTTVNVSKEEDVATVTDVCKDNI